MITLTFDTEEAVRAILPQLRAQLAGRELFSGLSDAALAKRVTAALVPVVVHRPPVQDRVTE